MLLFLQIERKVQICMKKSLAIFLSMLALVLTSCFNDIDNTASSPYAMLKSFSIGNITSKYPAYTSEGFDTTVTKTIQGSSYPFSINQVTCEVYNTDSLPFATKVDKVTFSMGLLGYAKIYVDSLDLFDAFLSTDSIDFTSPRKVRITSADGEYYRDYTIRVNVHQVNPDSMAWNRYEAHDIEGVTPLRSLEHDGSMCLFGEKDGQSLLAKTALQGARLWQQTAIAGLPDNADLATVQPFRGALYVVAADGIGVHAEVGQDQGFAAFPVKPQHVEPLIHMADGLQNIRIVHAGIGTNRAILHAVAARKSDIRCRANAKAHTGRL